MSKPRTRRRRVHLDIGRARIEPPDIDVQTGRARIRPEPYPNALYDYGEIVDDEPMQGGSVQTSDGEQFHEAMDIQARSRRGR